MFKLNMNEIVPLIKEVVSSGATFRLYPHGTSMQPTIRQGEDSVELSSPDNLKVLDAVLYQRENEQYVLHRIVRIHGAYLDMCGDNQLEIEKNVEKFRIIAKVTGIYREEKYISCQDKNLKAEIKKLYRKKIFQRIRSRIIKIIYPIYKAIFKK